MAVEISTLKPLIEGSAITSSAVDLYTVPASTKATVKYISIHNDHAATTETVTIWIIPSGGSAGVATKRYEQAIGPKQTYDFSCSHIMNAAAKITVQGATGAIASISASGFEITNAS